MFLAPFFVTRKRLLNPMIHENTIVLLNQFYLNFVIIKTFLDRSNHRCLIGVQYRWDKFKLIDSFYGISSQKYSA